MNDDIERTIEASLRRRAADLGDTGGHLGDVMQRVDRRRSRRRGVAAVGSVALVAVGVAGIGALRGDESVSPAADGPPVSGEASATSVLPDRVWRCTGEFARDMNDQTVSFFERCEAIEPAELGAVTTTLVNDGYPTATAPPTTSFDAPATTTTTIAPTVYIVEAGDTPTSIAERYGVAIGDLSTWNGWDGGADNQLRIGDEVVIWSPWSRSEGSLPPPTTSPGTSLGEQEYVIVAGDSLGAIADRYDVSLEALVNYNDFDGPDHLIKPGDLIKIPPNATFVLPTATTAPPDR